jgi:hypothetical protein
MEGWFTLGFFDKKSDHPMADMKSAQLLLQDLPRSDALKALYELNTWIESVHEHQDFQLDHQLAILRLLDETARPFERKLTRDYFSDKALTPFQANRIWMALNDFFQQLAQAYINVQMRCRNGDKGSATLQPALPLIAARGINALTGKLKCAAERYTQPDHAIWRSLAGIYAHAEAQQYLDEPVALYAGSGPNTSVRQEFASVLMWYASGISTLNPLQVHLAERLAAHFGRHFTVSPHNEADSLFFFDLQHPKPPLRVSTELKQLSGMRFLGAGSAQPHVNSLISLLEKNNVPETINLGGMFDAGTVQEVVRHLSVFWLSAPPVRRDTRHKVVVRLYVAQGYAGLMQLADAGPASDGGSESWTVEDISVSGVRCVLTPARTKGVVNGLLVATRPERSAHWGAGIVRRLSRDVQNNLHVGIELLSQQVTVVMLRESLADIGQSALCLNNPDEQTDEINVLMSPGAFSSSRSLHVVLAGKNYLLMPLKLLETGEDYDLMRYRKVEEDTGTDKSA